MTKISLVDPHPVDIYVGLRLRKRRRELGYSQNDLGSLVGLTFQQIQKYENAINRISCSKLYELGKNLNTSIDYFFGKFAYLIEFNDYANKNTKELNEYNYSGNTQAYFLQDSGEDEYSGLDDKNNIIINNDKINRYEKKLIIMFRKIEDPKLKARVINMVSCLIDSNSKA